MGNDTDIAVIESKWERSTNLSVRGLFELIADTSYENPHAYHYEMANCKAGMKEAINRISSYRDCKYLYVASHGDKDGLYLLNKGKITLTELRKLLINIKLIDGLKLRGLYLSPCLFGTGEIANFMFDRSVDVGISWLAGYSKTVDWIESSALDLLFFNELIHIEKKTDAATIQRVAKKLKTIAPQLVKALGFGIYVRKQRVGGAKNLLA